MFKELLSPILIKHNVKASIEEVRHSSMKEARIIDTLEPVIASHRLIVKASNTNFFKGANNKGYTKEIDMNQVIDIYLNGTKINYSATMPSITDADHDDWCWMGEKYFMPIVVQRKLV